MDLFSQDFVKEDLFFEKANNLIDLLNDGCKNISLRYWAKEILCFKDILILVAGRNNHENVFNILDLEGNTPKGLEVNWRSWNHIILNLKELGYELNPGNETIILHDRKRT